MIRVLGCEWHKGHRRQQALSQACRRTTGGVIEMLERRVLLASSGVSDALAMDASVSGQVFFDTDQNGTLDADEIGLEGWIVFADANGNGSLDAGEASATTDNQGAYRISALAPGSATIALMPQDGWTVAAAKMVTLQSGQEQKGANFGNYTPISVPHYDAAGDKARIDQDSYPTWPVIASDSKGNYVVVWQGWERDVSGNGIHAQRFDAAGNPIGAQIRVGLTLVPNSACPAVAMDADGGFVVVWESPQAAYGETQIHGRRYNASGEPQGEEFRIDAQKGSQKSPVVAMDAQGNFVVTWYSDYGGFGRGEVWVHRYRADGASAGESFSVNTATDGNETQPGVAMGANGDFIIVWRQGGVFGQRYNAAGEPQGDPFRVTNVSGQPAVAMGRDGSFVVGWTAFHAGVQRYNASGIPQGGNIDLGLSGANNPAPSIAMDNEGGFFIAWQSGSSWVEARRFDALGFPHWIGGDYSNPGITKTEHPAITVVNDGGVVLAWQMSNSGGGIYTQRCDIVRPPDPVIDVGGSAYIGRNGEDVWIYNTLAPIGLPWKPKGLPIAMYPISELNTLNIKTVQGPIAIDLSHGNPIPAGGLFIEGFSFSLDLDPASIVADFAVNIQGKTYVLFQPGRTLDTLNLLDTSRAKINAVNAVFAVNNLSIAPGASFDLGNNNLVVHATPETRDAVLADISGWIKSARADGTWSGPGLTSTQAKANKQMGLGVMLNDNGHGQPIFTTFQGQSVGVNDILIKYTWNGDVNLDGKVDLADYFLVDSGFIKQTGGYRNGDLNFDKKVDLADYFLIDSAFIAQTGTLAVQETPEPVDGVLKQLFSVKPLLS
ncbi:MAG TPA: SdrD B-like domain-containing protein [Tepidisphaeraceae bacterium]|nr:SdrD B-like domain-containing protein [Tepidisphaeraceae bacterium]